MMNFTGQTRRRNVNLGTRPLTTKKDLLLRAQLEREKRAKDRTRINAATKIQSFIRMHLTCQQFFAHDIWISDMEHSIHIFPAYGPRILNYDNEENLSKLLKLTKLYMIDYCSGSFRNYFATKLLSRIKTCCMLSTVLDIIDKDTLSMKTFMQNGLIPFLNHFEHVNETEATVSLIFEYLCSWYKDDFEAKSIVQLEIFQLNIHRCKSREFIEFLLLNSFLTFESSVFSHLLREPMRVLENYFIIYGQLMNKDTLNLRPYLSNANAMHLLERLVKDIYYIFPLVSKDSMTCLPTKDAYHIKNLFESKFIDTFLEKRPSYEHEVHFMGWYKFLQLADMCNKKTSVLLNFLSNKSLMFELFTSIDQSDSKMAFQLLIELMDLWLLVSTDFDLLSDSSKISMNQLISFTKSLKDLVFHNLWDLSKDDRSENFETALHLLNKLYLRDSRIHFVTKKRNHDEKGHEIKDPNITTSKDFWATDDQNFLKINIYKILSNYDDAYRSKAELNEDNNEEEAGMENENNTMKKRSLKLEVFEEMSRNQTRNETKQLRKLSILLRVPFFLPFNERVDLFYTLIALDKQRLNLDDPDRNMMFELAMPWMSNGMGRQTAVISREHVLEDAFNSYNKIGERFKSRLSVTFVNEFGPEAGIDGGGITKEFLTSVSEEGFKKSEYKLFETNDQYELYPSTDVTPEKLKYLWFMGKIVGKCLYEHVLIDVSFANFFLKKLLNYSNNFQLSFDDLSSLDSSLYMNLTKLLAMTDEEIQSLGLTFEMTSSTKDKPIELIPNGSHIPVTKENVLQYLTKVSNYKLNVSMFRQCVS